MLCAQVLFFGLGSYIGVLEVINESKIIPPFNRVKLWRIMVRSMAYWGSALILMKTVFFTIAFMSDTVTYLSPTSLQGKIAFSLEGLLNVKIPFILGAISYFIGNVLFTISCYRIDGNGCKNCLSSVLIAAAAAIFLVGSSMGISQKIQQPVPSCFLVGGVLIAIATAVDIYRC